MKPLSKTFGDECIAAGLPGVAWQDDGTVLNLDTYTPDQLTILNNVIAANDPTKTPPVVKHWTPLEFMELLTYDERTAARTLAKIDLMAEDWLDLLKASTEVRMDDPRTVAGLKYLVLRGVLTQDRVDALIA